MRMQMKTATDENGYRTMERRKQILEGEMRMQIERGGQLHKLKEGTIRMQMKTATDENAYRTMERRKQILEGEMRMKLERGGQ